MGTQSDLAVARRRKLVSTWRGLPAPSGAGDSASQAAASTIALRVALLQHVGVTPGAFAAESIPARGPGRRLTIEERRAINRLGAEAGCHTCGTKVAGTLSGNFIADHQVPTALNQSGEPQSLFPQCLRCSNRQGNWISHYLKDRR